MGWHNAAVGEFLWINGGQRRPDFDLEGPDTGRIIKKILGNMQPDPTARGLAGELWEFLQGKRATPTPTGNMSNCRNDLDCYSLTNGPSWPAKVCKGGKCVKSWTGY